MSHSWTQWLYFVDEDDGLCEFINGERLVAHLQTVSPGCGTFNVIEELCQWGDGTRPLMLDPCSEPQWQELGVFTTPTASSASSIPAPWWDGVANSPSSRALGIWIEDWTGMDGAHHKRNTGSRSGRRGGGTFGAMFSGFRTWKMNVLLVGQDEPALEELFRWMEDTLLDNCDPCGGADVMARTCCPPEDDPGFGLWMYRGVSLLEGPTWEDDPIPDLNCSIRRASFTLGVSDPCMYGCPTTCIEEEAIPAFPDPCVGIEQWMGCALTCDDWAPYRLCCPVPGVRRGTISPIVQIFNSSAVPSAPTRIVGMNDPMGLGCDPCALGDCQDIRIGAIPGGATLMVDSAQRRILYKDVSTNQTWVDGTPFIQLESGQAPDFLALACDGGWVAIEPTGFCGAGNFDDLIVTVQTQQVVGCARG